MDDKQWIDDGIVNVLIGIDGCDLTSALDKNHRWRICHDNFNCCETFNAEQSAHQFEMNKKCFWN